MKNLKAALFALLTLGILAFTASVSAADFHHVHLTATNAQEGADWYAKHMGGVSMNLGPFKVK